MRIKQFTLKAGTSTTMKQTSLYKAETSATMSAQLQKPIDGAPLNIPILRSGIIKSVRAYVTAEATDDLPTPKVWNMPCLGRVAINHGHGIYKGTAVLSPSWTVIRFRDEITQPLDIFVSAGTLSLSVAVHPIYLPHIAGSSITYTNVTVSISVVIEVEES